MLEGEKRKQKTCPLSPVQGRVLAGRDWRPGIPDSTPCPGFEHLWPPALTSPVPSGPAACPRGLPHTGDEKWGVSPVPPTTVGLKGIIKPPRGGARSGAGLEREEPSIKEAGPAGPQGGGGGAAQTDVAEPTGSGVASLAGGVGESGPVASGCGDHPPGFGLYADTRASLTFSRRHSSGSRFSAAIASQRHNSRTRFSSSLDAAITTPRLPASSAGAIL